MIWVIGSGGMLGKELCEYLRHHKIKFFGTDKDCDILDFNALENFSSHKHITWIVNCSAYTSVDKAEDESEIAFKINAEGVGNVAVLAKSIGAKFIHISTDYVFGDSGTIPYKEDNSVNPLGVYGKSKLAGEYLVKKYSEKYFIIRTSWLYGEYGNNFVCTIIRLLKERESIDVVNDQVGSPTWSYNLAEAIYTIIKNDSANYGIYHFSNEGSTTWYEFAVEILKYARNKGLVNCNVVINPVTSGQYPTNVRRPLYSVLDSSKIISMEGIKLISWKKSLNKFLDLVLSI